MPSRRDQELLESLRRRKNGSVLQMIQTLEVCAGAQRQFGTSSRISCEGEGAPQINRQRLQQRIKHLEQKGLRITTNSSDSNNSCPALITPQHSPRCASAKRISTCRKQFFEASPISISCTDEEYNNTRFQSDIIPSGKTVRTVRLYEQGLVYGDCIDDESFASATSEAPGQPALAAEPLISGDKPFEIGIVTPPRSCSRRRRTSKSTCNSICNNDLTWKILAVASEVESAYEMRHVKRLRCKDSADPVPTKSSPSTRKATHKTKTPPRIITPSKKLVQECGFKMIENIHDVEHSDDSTASLSCDSSVGSKSSIRTSSEEFIVQMPTIELRTGSVQIPETLVARSAAVVSQIAALSNMPFFLVVYLLFLLCMNPLAANVTVDL